MLTLDQSETGLKLTALNLPNRHTTTSKGLAFITGFQLHSLDLTNYINVGDEGMQHVGKITRFVLSVKAFHTILGERADEFQIIDNKSLQAEKEV